ncbi:MAG: dockerin type I repeat-containing protein [Acutalibacteraceae bacterium]
MKSSYFKVFPLSFILCIFIVFFGFHSHAINKDSELFSTGSDYFLLCDSSPITVYLADKTGTVQKKAFASEDIVYQNAQMNRGGLYIFCSNDFNYNGYKEYHALMIICNTNGSETDQIFFDDISLKTDCAAYDTSKIYLVDNRSPDTIQIYTKDGGKPQTSVFIGSAVQKLFVYDNSNVYAITADGVYAVNSSKAIKIGSVKPQADFYFYGNLCCTSDGKIYTFDTQSGFSLYFSSDYQYTAVMKNKIYAAAHDKIYCLDTNGTISAVYTSNSTITALCASNNSLAFISDGTVYIITANDFSPVQSEISHEVSDNTSSSHPVSQNSEITDTSQITSSVYDLTKNIIELPSGKTIAQIKKEITYTGYTAQFSDHNHKTKTSGILGTGATLTLTDGSKSHTYTFLVCGDISGEGNINTRDITALSDYLIYKSDLTELQLKAADLNKDNIVNTSDLLSLYKQTALL